MKIRFLITILALGINACTSSIVTRRGFSNTKYAPTNESSLRGGTVKYLAQGWDSGIAKRREDAYKKAHNTCAGPYTIDREYVQQDGGSAITTGQWTTYGGEKWMYIDFTCNTLEPTAQTK